jgi:hypothetical protein
MSGDTMLNQQPFDQTKLGIFNRNSTVYVSGFITVRGSHEVVNMFKAFGKIQFYMINQVKRRAHNRMYSLWISYASSIDAQRAIHEINRKTFIIANQKVPLSVEWMMNKVMPLNGIVYFVDADQGKSDRPQLFRSILSAQSYQEESIENNYMSNIEHDHHTQNEQISYLHPFESTLTHENHLYDYGIVEKYKNIAQQHDRAQPNYCIGDQYGLLPSKIMIIDFPSSFTSQDLRILFENSGSVTSIFIPYSKSIGRIGCAYVTMGNYQEACRAITDINGLQIQERVIVVKHMIVKYSTIAKHKL